MGVTPGVDGWTTQVGEGFAGNGVDAAHLNTVLGARGGPLEAAWVTALATPRQGHIPFVVVAAPNVAVRPPTLFVNKAPLTGDRHERLTWGPAQAGVAGGVADALGDETIPPGDVGRLLLIAAVWVNPAAQDPDAVYRHNRSATHAALRAGASGGPPLAELLRAGEHPVNPYFGGPR
ncbi:MAG TPA: formaldehyde-activating enzyme [Acidimicrobiia bacterium]|nr:formaldehyde-activating enzyme [Acidimicrobiia bacterium]